jgi:hypothetical protein
MYSTGRPVRMPRSTSTNEGEVKPIESVAIYDQIVLDGRVDPAGLDDPADGIN